MAKSRLLSKWQTRKIKSGVERRRRLKVHRLRLIALGVPETEILGMTSSRMRELLRTPCKTKAKYA
ncbi:MAG: hypothetical protein E4H02_11475 [Lentisphaerales bacterium]|jgi:hypothetical protein|nr:MAG: hypothetical protein E4H02_11475 [Lentisphaerales bacterium]